ncbi:FHA domain-containing protein [Streptomyces sp. NPDC006251]|uniref:FHA domain-containing protein n=1 Tax=Streptomyces sp. NPDC006251 TaxID=3155718 RepID=UPI0033A83E25
MQIRLTVVDPLGPSAPGRDRAPRSDVLVTAPAGTALAAVASALAQVVSGGDGSGTPVLYAGEQRLDAQRCTLGEPPLTDGAVLSVGAPGEPEPHPEWDDAPAQLQVVAGPDAGGVHLLHGGEIRIGRSADADVPLDDPDVSRLHCAVTVGADGRVSVADLDSTNGTTLDGTRVGSRAVRFAPGALLRIGESALRLAPAGGPWGGRVETTPDGEGHVRVPGPADSAPPSYARGAGSAAAGTSGVTGRASAGTSGVAGSASVGPSGVAGPASTGTSGVPGPASAGTSGVAGPGPSGVAGPGPSGVAPAGPSGPTHHAHGSAAWGTPGATGRGSGEAAVPGRGGASGQAVVPGQGGAPRIEGGPASAGSAGPQAPGQGSGARSAGSGGVHSGGGGAHPGSSGDEVRSGGGGSGVHPGGSGSRGRSQGNDSAGRPGGSGSGVTPGSDWSAVPRRGAGGDVPAGGGPGGVPSQGIGGEASAGRGRGVVHPQGVGGEARSRTSGDASDAGDGPPSGTAGAAHPSPGPQGARPGSPERWLRAPQQRGAARPGSGDGDTHVGRSGAGASGHTSPHDTGARNETTYDTGRPRTGTADGSATPHAPSPTGTDTPIHPDERTGRGHDGAHGQPTPHTRGLPTGPDQPTGRDHDHTHGQAAPHTTPPTGTNNPSHPDHPTGRDHNRTPGSAAREAAGRAGVGESAEAPDGRAGRGRKGTPLRGTDMPSGTRKRGGLGAWARRWAGGRGEQTAAGREAYGDEPADVVAERPVLTPAVPETWPDPAALLLTALGPGPRLWERGPGHPEALAVRLGTADRAALDGSGLLPAVPVTTGLREVGALGLAGPRTRLAGLARAVLAQLAALHSPDTLEIVLIAADRSRPLEERTAEWSWLGWLPHVRPGHGQDCRLLLAHDREQAAARTDELLRRLEDHLADSGAGTDSPVARPDSPVSGTDSPVARPDRPVAGSGSPVAGAPGAAPSAPASGSRGGDSPVPPRANRPSWAVRDDAPGPATAFPGPYTVLVVDGDPGGAGLRDAVARLALEGPRAGIHVVCLAETAAASPASPVTETYEAACSVAPAFRQCGAVALLSGDVATALRLMRVARVGGDGSPAGPVGHGTIATVDAVSPAWAERFARALAPLRPDGTASDPQPRVSAPLPQAARLLDELGLARATPASLMARWADAADDTDALGGRVRAVLGAGPRGPVCADLAAQGPHLLIEGPPGSGRTELLRAVVASLAAAERPDRLGIVLVDGRGGPGAGGGHGEGLRVCTDVPHVTTHLTAHDPVRMREFAQSLTAELKRRAELLGRSDFAEWHTGRELSGRMVAQRTATARGGAPAEAGAGDLDSPPSSTMRLRPGGARRQPEAAAPPLPRLVVVVDDLDALVSPALGSTGRPAAGSVMRALEAVARDGERLGVHLVAATGPCARTAETEPARRATLRVTLDTPAPGPDEPAPGRGSLTGADGRTTPFQGGRVTGRIPRTATLRPTVVPLEWHRMGDPPARRPVRELGNGPTDLALLASALERAAREVAAAKVPSLL